MITHERLASHGEEIIQAAPQLYLDIDVEADGIPGYGSLLSVGAVSPWGDTYYAELKPTSERYIEEYHDFCEAHQLERSYLLQNGRNLNEVMEELQTWTHELVETHHKEHAVLTAFNASYDFPWINLAMQEVGIESPFGVAGYCIKSLANQLSRNYDWRMTSKGKLPAVVVPAGDFTHNALEDAQYQQKIHNALVGAIKLGLYESTE